MSRQSPSASAELAAPGAGDRRAWKRYSCNLEGKCQPLLGGKEVHWMGMVQEVSRGGIRLVLNRRFEVGTLLQVEIRRQQKGNTDLLLVRVVHVMAERPQWWALGCAFVGEITDDEIQLLL
jgi:hypothetical protein